MTVDYLQLIGSLEPIQVYHNTCPCMLPQRDYYSNWVCMECGSRGKIKVKYKSALRTRVRAHYKCRCKA